MSGGDARNHHELPDPHHLGTPLVHQPVHLASNAARGYNQNTISTQQVQ